MVWLLERHWTEIESLTVLLGVAGAGIVGLNAGTQVSTASWFEVRGFYLQN
jgi:hypothetical protein